VGCTELPYRVTNYHTVSTGIPTQVKTSLFDDGPSYFRYDVYNDFMTFWGNGNPGDVYVNSAGTNELGGHAVLIIGWNNIKGAYLLKNSWGPTGGPNGDGTFWMAYSGHAHNLNFGMANFDLSEAEEWNVVYDQMFTDASAALSPLRSYRDKTLAANAQGRQLVSELYEKHSAELVKILRTKPGLTARGALIIKGHLPGIKKVLNGGTMEMTRLQLAQVSKFLSDVASVGSAELKEYISSVQAVLKDEKALASLGIKVVKWGRRAPGLKKGSLTATWGSIKTRIQEQ